IPGGGRRCVARWCLAGVLGLAGDTLVFVCVAHAAGWSVPQKVASSKLWQYERPQLAIDVFGDAVVAWHRQEELNGRLSGVEAVTRRANAPWSSPVTLRGPRQGGAYAPEVAMDSSGNATAAWSSLSRVEAVSHPVGGSWGRTAKVSQRGPRADAFQLAVGARGNAAVVYEQNFDLGLATRRPGAHWRAPGALPGISSLGVDAPRVVIDGRGEMIIAWVHAQPGKRVQALVLGANGKPEGPIQTLSRKGPVTELQLAANADGDAVVVWREEGKNIRPIEAATRPVRGRWSAAKPVAPAGRGSTFTPQVAAGPSSGLLMAVWGASVGPAPPVIEASILSPQGTWQTPVAISPVGSFTPSITLSANGDATAAWIHQEPLSEPSNVGPQEQPSFTESIETADYEPE